MPTSDSEDFESADEGHGTIEKKDRKKRNSSSNYSDNALESVVEAKSSSCGVDSKIKAKVQMEETEGWVDFDIDDNEPVTQLSSKHSSTDKPNNTQSIESSKKPAEKSEDTGWDDFGDWENDDTAIQKEQPKASRHEKDLQQMSEHMAGTGNTSTSSGWGWGWGVDSILSTASAGLTTLTNQVSQGITTVLETGIGAPDPEELARRSKEQESEVNKKTSDDVKTESKPDETASGEEVFDPFGSILKFVGTTGSKVITGGLDTLETIGRKTFEVLQEGDPHLAKKRALLGLDPATPVLSQVLREAKAKAEEEDQALEQRREAKEIHYERLFDDFEGLVHLEALEMLAKQVNMQIEERLQSASSDKKLDMKETLQQVAELCEIPDEDDEEDDDVDDQDKPKDEVLLERLQNATGDLGVKLQFQTLIKQYKEILDWLANPDSDFGLKSVHKRAITSLAQATAYSVEIYHKAGEMLLIKPRRMTADESDAMTQMTQVLCKHIAELARLYTTKLDSVATEETSADSKTYITNIFLQAGNSATYVKNALILTHPILQIGAI